MKEQLLPTWLCALATYLVTACIILWLFTLPGMDLWGIIVSTLIVLTCLTLIKSVLSDLPRDDIEKIFLYYWWKKLFRNDYES